MRAVTRNVAIGDIRQILLTFVDEDHSMCETAGRMGIYCHGFKNLSDAELFERYRWIVQNRGVKTREELEDLANRWQLAQQFIEEKPLSCDVQSKQRDTCCGWETFTNEQLEGFYRKICGDEVIVLKD